MLSRPFPPPRTPRTTPRSSPRRPPCGASSRPEPGSSSYGYAGAEGGEVNDVVDRAQAAIYEVTERSTSEDYVALEELLQPTMDEIDAIASRGGVSLGVPTGFADLDAATNGLHPGQMIVVAARPGLGKSTLGLDFAAVLLDQDTGMTSVVFSLEMSKSEIVMRLLSAEARIKLADMRSGRMSDDDWTRLARRMSEISEAPLFIDDSPNLTMMEIRAKARRLKQRTTCKLVIVDYLQLMTSGKQGRVAPAGGREFSRQHQAAGQGARGPGGGDQPAEPRPGTAHRQAADDLGPARVGLPHRRAPECCAPTPAPR